jgi:hypothetical protein
MYIPHMYPTICGILLYVHVSHCLLIRMCNKTYTAATTVINLGPKGNEIIVMPLVCVCVRACVRSRARVLLEDKGVGTGCMILIVLMCPK